MSNYNTLVNLRFNRTSGPIDLVQNSWSSKASGIDYTIDLVDYSSAGQFSGNCATFNGESSYITKVSGNYLSLSADQEFTISMWVNTDLSEDGMCQILLSDGDTENFASKLYIYNEQEKIYIVFTDRNEYEFISRDVKDSFRDNQWNYLAVIKFADGEIFKCGIFLNGYLVSEYTPIINPVNFDKVRATIGMGYTPIYNRLSYFEGRLDDIVILNNAIPIENDEIAIPTDYLIIEEDEEDQVVWEDKEPEYSRYSSIVSETERLRFNNKKNINNAQSCLIPYRVYPVWKQVEEMYFKDGKYYVNRDIHSIKIVIKGIWSNHFFKEYNSIKYIDTTFDRGYKNNTFNPALLFIDGKFVPWSTWHIVKSDHYITFVIDNYSYKYEVEHIEMIMLPGSIYYSERGIMPNEGYRMFGYTKNGGANGYNIVISNTDPNLYMLKYPNIHENSTIEVDIDISMKLTDSNIFIFEAGTNNEAKPNYEITIGNYLTIMDEGNYDVYVFYNTLHNKSEDNLVNIPNEKLVREYLQFPYDSYQDEKTMPVNLVNLHHEFDWVPTWNGNYNDKYYNSMTYIFEYNRNKFDKVYEEIKPVNNIEISGKEFNSLKDETGRIILGRDHYEEFDVKNNCYIIIFVNGILPDWYKNIEYITNNSIEIHPDNNIQDTDVIEICFFRNICNELFKYNGSSYELNYDNKYIYIPKEDLLVYTDRKGYLNLNPIMYEIDEMDNVIRLEDEKYSNYGIFIGSRRQFLYKRIPVNKETQVIPIPYAFRTGYNPNNYLLFLNGRLLDPVLYRIVVPSLNDNRIKFKSIYFIKPLNVNDRLDLFYVSGTCDKLNTSGDLVIKAIKVQASFTNQKKFLIPLPYSNYPIDYDSFMIMNKSLRMSTDKYKLSSIDVTKTVTRWNEDIGDNETIDITYTNYYVEFMDQDDYLIPGEELTFLFPYYKAEWETIDEPTSDNTLQFITRYAKLTEDSAEVTFSSDYMGNIEDKRFIYVFVNTDLIDPKDYIISDANTILFNNNLSAGSEVAMVIETDRYNFKDNNVLIKFSNIVVTEYGQTNLELPIEAISSKEFIFFRNNKLLPSDTFTINGNKLLLDKTQEDLLPGDLITAVYAIDGGTNTNTINFQSYIIKAILKNTVDIPNFTNIRYTNNNILVFVNNEFIPNTYYKVSGNTINFIDNAYIGIIDDTETYIASNRGSDIVNINDEVTIFIAYKSINPNSINYDLGNKEFIRFTETTTKVTNNEQSTFIIPYPNIISSPFRDIRFLLFIRGIFIPEINYELNEEKTSITILNSNIELKVGDELTFLFCHMYDLTDINKEEFSVNLANGQNSFTMPSVFTSTIDLSNRILVFYGGTYIDPQRYNIDRLTRTITLNDIPGENDINRTITIVFLYSGLSSNGSIAILPQSGYICFNEHYIDRNYNKEMYMIFVNGKKVPKSYIYDITNSIKKITVDIKTRYDLVVLSTSPLISEFKRFYNDEEFIDYFNVTIEKVANGVIEVTTGSGGVYYNNFTAKYGEYFKAKYIPDRGYLPGTIFVNDEEIDYGNVFDDVIIRADGSEAGTFRSITIEQKEFETIYVKCNGSTYKDNFLDIEGSELEINVSNERIGYHTGALHVDGTDITYDENKNAYIGIIGENNINITIDNPIIDTIPFKVINENMYGQTLTVEFYDENNSIIRTYNELGTTIFIPYGSRVKFTLKSTDPRYKRGSNVGPFKVNNFYMVDYSYPFTDLIPEPVSPVRRYYIDIKQSTNELLYVDTYPDIELIDSVETKVRHIESFYGSSNDIYTIGVEANYGYTAGNIIISNDKLYGSIKESFSVTVSPAILDTVLFTIAKHRQAIGSITAVLESGETVGIGMYIVQNNSSIKVITRVNGVTTEKIFTITTDQTVTLDINGNMIFDPEVE